jgi:hypothetical protein
MSLLLGGCIPGDEESAGVNYSHRSPKGNRHMRRVLNEAANAAVQYFCFISRLWRCSRVEASKPWRNAEYERGAGTVCTNR